MLATSIVQLLVPRQEWLTVEESLASISGVLIIGFGPASETNGHLVAEGVETEAELETLRALGVDLVQGYYLGRPGWPWPEVRRTGQTRTRARTASSIAIPAPRVRA